MFHILFILGACLFGGMGFGSFLVAGIMLWDGRWTLPGTTARELQRLKLRQTKLEFDIKLEQDKMLLEDMQHNRLVKALNRGND